MSPKKMLNLAIVDLMQLMTKVVDWIFKSKEVETMIVVTGVVTGVICAIVSITTTLLFLTGSVSSPETAGATKMAQYTGAYAAIVFSAYHSDAILNAILNAIKSAKAYFSELIERSEAEDDDSA